MLQVMVAWPTRAKATVASERPGTSCRALSLPTRPTPASARCLLLESRPTLGTDVLASLIGTWTVNGEGWRS